MIEVIQRTIRIDEQPALILSGEVHYFRLPRDAWRDRLEKLKAAGCNTCASYIPWLCHEPVRGEFDLDGHTRPQLALGEFVDLCADLGLWFIARPGPFIMAEMKNEGVPYELYSEHPEIVPVGWDGEPAPTRTLDYLAPAFLEETNRWYGAVMAVLRPRLQPNGGNVIAVQLDNEVGMLSWVSNAPDLTDLVLDDFWAWLEGTLGADERGRRYPFASAERNAAVRSPSERTAAWLFADLARYMRHRYATYFQRLKTMAEECGITGVPFVINIHGTEAGGGATYPIGISQLMEAYGEDDAFISGSDHYLGNLTAANAPDWYLMNAYMEATNSPNQPLTSMEFEAGEGDYGGSMGARLDPSAVDFKLRMAVAQGNRLINYYLFTGGYNDRMDRETGDGNDRISFTGERHGIGAPVNPEGALSYTYDRLARTDRMLLAHEAQTAAWREERDNLTMGFIPDAYATEAVYPGNGVQREIADALRRSRFGGPGCGLARALMQLTVRYTALDLQRHAPDPDEQPVLALGSVLYMDEAVQRKLIDYVEAGGNLLLHGDLPLFDMARQPCSALVDALGLAPVGRRLSDHRYFLSLNAEGWAAPRAEWRAGWAQTFEPLVDGTILQVYGADEAAGFDLRIGRGRVIAITAEIPVDLDFWSKALDRLGVTRGLRHTCSDANIFMTLTAAPDGSRFVHALNLDGYAKIFGVIDGGSPLFGGRDVSLSARGALMMPINLPLPGGGTLRWATMDVSAIEPTGVRFRVDESCGAALFDPDVFVQPGDGYTVAPADSGTLVEVVDSSEVRVAWG